MKQKAEGGMIKAGTSPIPEELRSQGGNDPADPAMRRIIDELIRRIEASPLMDRAASAHPPEDQARLGDLLRALTILRDERTALMAVPDLPLSVVEALWPDLAAVLVKAGNVTVSASGARTSIPPSSVEHSLQQYVIPRLTSGAPTELRDPALAEAAVMVEHESVRPTIAVAEERQSTAYGAAEDSTQIAAAHDEQGQPVEAGTPHLVAPAVQRASATRRLVDRFPALGYPNFVLLWTGLIVSSAGTQMQNVAVNWLVLDLWHSPLAVGIVSLAFAVPMIALPYLGGAIADRVDRLRLLKMTQVGQMGCAGLLTILASAGIIQIWEIVALVAISASFLAFDNPTRQAIFPDLVGRRHLMSAISLQSAAFTGGALVGPAIGGALLSSIHPSGIFFLNMLSYLAVLSALSQMHALPQHTRAATLTIGRWLTDGLRYVWQTKIVLLLLSLSFVGNLLGRSYLPLLAVFARNVFHVDAAHYGLMVAATGLGALAGAIVLAGSGDVAHKGRIYLAGTALFCLTLWLFAWAPPYPVAIALLVLAGVASTAFSASIATLLQARVPRELRGRVMSLYTITLIGVSSLGALGFSAVAAASSAPDAYAGGALLFALCALPAAGMLWQLRDGSPAPARVAAETR